MPALVVPSPQSIVATRSEAGVTVSVSVKFATTTLLSAWLVFVLSEVPVPDRASCSPTATVPEAVAWALSDVRVTVTLTGSLPSSA